MAALIVVVLFIWLMPVYLLQETQCAVVTLFGKLTLVTPVDKSENIKFYTEKCGFDIVSTERDGNVEVARFVLER